MAIEKGNTEIVKLLLSCTKIDVNLQVKQIAFKFLIQFKFII